MEGLFDKEYTLGFAKEILEVDSPSGMTGGVKDRLAAEAERLGYELKRTNKGNGYIHVKGHGETVGYCAHVDTLGLMVRAVKSNGTLAVTTIGGPILPTLDGEYCRIVTREGKTFTGTILCNSPTAHVYPDSRSKERNEATLLVRIDETVKSREDVKKLGISAGDFICIDTKTEITQSGFIKSRFLDDKLSAAALFGVLKYWKDHPGERRDAIFMFSTYEEVGHGMSSLPMPLKELVCVDMGCIGEDLGCTEYDVSVCAKDSSGPYDFDITNKLIALAKQINLKYAVDIYPFYSSDASAAVRGGNDLRAGLIGPGVHASHGMERSHYSAVENTMKLINAYAEA